MTWYWLVFINKLIITRPQCLSLSNWFTTNIPRMVSVVRWGTYCVFPLLMLDSSPVPHQNYLSLTQTGTDSQRRRTPTPSVAVLGLRCRPVHAATPTFALVSESAQIRHLCTCESERTFKNTPLPTEEHRQIWAKNNMSSVSRLRQVLEVKREVGTWDFDDTSLDVTDSGTMGRRQLAYIYMFKRVHNSAVD